MHFLTLASQGREMPGRAPRLCVQKKDNRERAAQAAASLPRREAPRAPPLREVPYGPLCSSVPPVVQNKSGDSREARKPYACYFFCIPKKKPASFQQQNKLIFNKNLNATICISTI